MIYYHDVREIVMTDRDELSSSVMCIYLARDSILVLILWQTVN